MSTTTTSKVASMDPATTITGHEMQQVERANATGLQPVVFVHGLWRRSGRSARSSIETGRDSCCPR